MELRDIARCSVVSYGKLIKRAFALYRLQLLLRFYLYFLCLLEGISNQILLRIARWSIRRPFGWQVRYLGLLRC